MRSVNLIKLVFTGKQSLNVSIFYTHVKSSKHIHSFANFLKQGCDVVFLTRQDSHSESYNNHPTKQAKYLSLAHSLHRADALKSYHFIDYWINSPHFMGPDGSLPCSEGPSPPVPFLSLINSVHPSPSNLSIWTLFYHIHRSLPSCLFPSGFSTKTLYTNLSSIP
jgi:hypothetical protein